MSRDQMLSFSPGADAAETEVIGSRVSGVLRANGPRAGAPQPRRLLRMGESTLTPTGVLVVLEPADFFLIYYVPSIIPFNAQFVSQLFKHAEIWRVSVFSRSNC